MVAIRLEQPDDIAAVRAINQDSEVIASGEATVRLDL